MNTPPRTPPPQSRSRPVTPGRDEKRPITPDITTAAGRAQLSASPVSQASSGRSRRPLPAPEPSIPAPAPAYEPPPARRRPPPAASVISNSSDIISTNFITALLSEDERSLAGSERVAPVANRHYASSFVTSDNMSAISEMTYPPTSRYFSQAHAQRPVHAAPPVPPFPHNPRQRSSTTERRNTPSRSNTDPRPVQEASLYAGPMAGAVGHSVPVASSPPIPENAVAEYFSPATTPPPNSPPQNSYQFEMEERNALGVPEFISVQRPTHGRRPSNQTSRTGRTQSSSLSNLKRTVGGWFSPKDSPRRSPIPEGATSNGYGNMAAAMPLSDEESRARDPGHNPHRSIATGYDTGYSKFPLTDSDPAEKGPDRRSPATPEGFWARTFNSKASSNKDYSGKFWTKKKIIITVVVLIVIIAVAVGAGVGATRKAKRPSCSGTLAGNSCNLDGSCVCTSSANGQCNPLAKVVVDLVPYANSFFNENFTTAGVAASIFAVQGSVVDNDCTAQANAIDVAPGLSSNTPNRTTWAQAALLWNYVLSQSDTANGQLQAFVQQANWKSLSGDGPVSDPSGTFATTQSGYSFDFASQTITAPSVSFVSTGGPNQQQLAKVSDNARAALDRIYTSALAASTQRQTALRQYWTTTLSQRNEDLSTFLGLINVAPILLPFDASSTGNNGPISTLSNSTTVAFPPPQACYPGLNNNDLQALSAAEQNVFGLQSISSASKFDSSCYTDRPIYGVLDILQLRLPFYDSRNGVAKQAVYLTTDASARIVYRSGELFSAMPGTRQPTGATIRRRQYGTSRALNNVMYDYLTSLDVSVAKALVQFVLSFSQIGAVPPTSSTNPLFSSLATLPLIEVAVFGTINAGDVKSTFSSLSVPSNNQTLFFGTPQSVTLRNWAITSGSSMVWTPSAVSPQVVRDNTYNNTVFNGGAFAPAVQYFAERPNQTVNSDTIVNQFTANRLFTS